MYSVFIRKCSAACNLDLKKMIAQQDWVTRKFNFDFPAEQFPVMIARLRGTFPHLKYITEGLQEKVLCCKPDDKWSIKEQIGHLIDLEPLGRGRVTDFKERREVLRAWDGTNAGTDAAQYNARRIIDLVNIFSTARDAFVAELLRLRDADHAFRSLHPRLQVMMRPVDLAYFVAEHDAHHIAKIYALIERCR